MTAFLIISVINSIAVIGILLTAVAYRVWLERKFSAHIPNRWGPSRVAPSLAYALAKRAKQHAG